MELVLLLCMCIGLVNSQRQNPNPYSDDTHIYFREDVPRIRKEMYKVTPNRNILPPAAPLKTEESDSSEELSTIKLDDSATALTNFSLNLINKINARKTGNIVVSPYSVATTLSLLQQGATATSLQQISDALQLEQKASAAIFKANFADIQSRASRNTLRTANNLFLANGFTINPGYRSLAQTDYKCDLTPTNFASAIHAAKDINNWVAMMTNNKITNLLSPESIGIDTQMVLVNAIYFKGFWQAPFKKQSTVPGRFRMTDGTEKLVEYMNTRQFYRATWDSFTDTGVVVLPFERNEYSLMILLPSAILTVHDMLLTLTVPQLEKYLNSPLVEVVLQLPKFSIRDDTDLVTVLKAMGITKIFEQQSDLTNIGSYKNVNPQVSSAVHSALLSIDEEGATAAAATSFSVVALSNTDSALHFIVNRPFVAVLWDSKARIPLFMASIEDPMVE